MSGQSLQNDLSDDINATRPAGHDQYFNNYCKTAASNEINQHRGLLVGRKLNSCRRRRGEAGDLFDLTDSRPVPCVR